MEFPFELTLLRKLLYISLLFPSVGFSQQNFFNVPSIEITDKKSVFMQQQINFSTQGPPIGFSTLNWGLGRNVEIGINLFGVSFANKKEMALPSTMMMNGLKKISLTPLLGIGLGGQFGMNRQKDFMAFSYQNVVFTPHKGIKKLVVGLFQGNSKFVGEETFSNPFSRSSNRIKWGVQAGIEKEIIPNHLTFQSDLQWGTVQNQQIISGIVLQTHEKYFWSLGRSFSGWHSQVPNYWVFEFTFSPQEKKNRE